MQRCGKTSSTCNRPCETATLATPVTLPNVPELDSDGSDVIGSDVDDWGADWTVGLN